MAVNSRDLPHVLVSFYAGRAGTLMSPVFGVVVRTGRRVYACSVAHAVGDRDDGLAVWNGIHPEVARQYGMTSEARCLAHVELRNAGSDIVCDEDRDLMAVPLVGYDGASLDAHEDLIAGDIGLLRPALIAFPEYEPDDQDVLRRSANGIAGLVSWEDARHCVLSAQGSVGMSGSAAMIATEGGLHCIGLYTGTRRINDLTPKAIESLAQVTKMAAFVRDLEG